MNIDYGYVNADWTGYDQYGSITPATYTNRIYDMYVQQLSNPGDPNSKVFSFDYDFYTDIPGAKEEFERKFILNYINEEISQETVFKWKLTLKGKIDNLMVLMKKRYQTELETASINYMNNKDYTESYTYTTDSTNKGTDSNQTDGTNTNTNTTTNNGLSKFSDTPQNSVSDIGDYLTNATSNTDNMVSNYQDDLNSKYAGNYENTSNTTFKEQRHGIGNIGVTSASQLLTGWRDILIDIDNEIINHKSIKNNMFMNLY